MIPIILLLFMTDFAAASGVFNDIQERSVPFEGKKKDLFSRSMLDNTIRRKTLSNNLGCKDDKYFVSKSGYSCGDILAFRSFITCSMLDIVFGLPFDEMLTVMNGCRKTCDTCNLKSFGSSTGSGYNKNAPKAFSKSVQSIKPKKAPTSRPTRLPSNHPVASPSFPPTKHPTSGPTEMPTTKPTQVPSAAPSSIPTFLPSTIPSVSPSTPYPTTIPPSSSPTFSPIDFPSLRPSFNPTRRLTPMPTNSPTRKPSVAPSVKPTLSPSRSLTQTHITSIIFSTEESTLKPINISKEVSPFRRRREKKPTTRPSIYTPPPTLFPSNFPSTNPTSFPTVLDCKDKKDFKVKFYSTLITCSWLHRSTQKKKFCRRNAVYNGASKKIGDVCPEACHKYGKCHFFYKETINIPFFIAI
uniref:ShKT domain-containing protein n=1 Tax=Corethron hystrix TaxID=216773 RepID=A0A7S1BEW9_9STRA|mmetsp:Transcript_22564/g.51683  ORF Transcript_22564/g.51683 Transcript_22564/m.51683 type:complete len:411 (+) Transcript_22564:258-1490(+)